MSTFDELRRRTNAMAQHISDYTGVSYDLVINVIHYAKRLTPPDTPDMIDESVFVAQMGKRFGITSRFIIQLIFESLKARRSKHMTIEEYVRMICIFQSNNLNIKVDFVFKVYDFNLDGFIDYKEMYHLLESSIVIYNDEDRAQQVKELVDLVIASLDTNSDGKISLTEFRGYVGRDLVCLELFGQVLPYKSVMDSFIALLKDKSTLAIKDYFTNERSICLNEPSKKRSSNKLYRVSLDYP